MLAMLQLYHAEILAALDEMDILTAQQQPAILRLPAVRLKLTQASRKRTTLLDLAYPTLMSRATSSERAKLKALQMQGAAGLSNSSQHIRTWTVHEVSARWFDYRKASNKMRSAMRLRVREEASLIYPMLGEESGSTHLHATDRPSIRIGS